MFPTTSLAIAAALCAPTPAQETGEPPSSFHWADFDADGYADALVVAPDGRARLFHNQGDGTLADVTGPAGIGEIAGVRLALWEDLDGDGRADLFLAGSETTHVFRNLGEGLFEDASPGSGLPSTAVLHAGKLDYDRDGRVDLHLRTVTTNLLFRNAGEGAFERVELGAEAVPTEVSFATLPSSATAAEVPSDVTTPPERTRETSGRQLVPAPGRGLPAPDGVEAAGLPPGGSISATPLPWCARALKDQATGACLYASTVPALGKLYPLSSDLFVAAPKGFVGLGTTTPTERLEVVGRTLLRGSVPGPIVKGDSQYVPLTRGYLGVQGSPDFDGVASADWTGFEIGAAGISTGGSASDNYGLLGHSNGIGVRGESSLAPAADYGELGRPGVGVRAAGSTLAGDFLGDVDVSGALDVAGTTTLGQTELHDDDIRMYNNADDETIRLVPEAGSGGALQMYNDAGMATVLADSDYAGSGAGRFYVRNANGATRVQIDGGYDPLDAGSILIDAPDGDPAIHLHGGGQGPSGEISISNSDGDQTIQLVGDVLNSGVLRIFNRYSSPPSEAVTIYGSGPGILLKGDDETKLIELSETSDGGLLWMFQSDGSEMALLSGFSNSFYLSDHDGNRTIRLNGSTGTKSAVAATSQGRRLLYAMESPEVWVEDFGRSQLVNGRAQVDLDPLFLETVTIDERHPMHVHVTPTAPSLGMWVEEGHGWFVVHELGDGRGNATFNWRVSAKRKGVEDERLELAEDPAETRGAARLEPQDG